MPSIADCTAYPPRLDERLPFAVVGRDVVWCGAEPIETTPKSVADLGELAEAHELAQIWIHETALSALGLPSGIDDASPPAARVHGFTDASGPWQSSRPELAGRAYWWRKGADGFDLLIPTYGRTDNAFRGVRSAAELLAAVAAWHIATRGARWMGTGAITSDVLIRELLGERLEASQCPPPVVEKSAAELALYWHRRPDVDAGRRYRFVHALDVNAAYLTAAGSIELGAGAVRHVDFPPSFGRPAPGLYGFDLEASPWRFVEPAPYVRPSWTEEAELFWCTAPTAERLVQYGLEPIEAWLYGRQSRYLRPWYERLRDARAELLGGPWPALEAVRQTYRQGIGRLAADEGRTLSRGVEYLDDEPAFQPVWSWSVIAEARCRLQRKIAGLDELPVAVDTDALYFLSSRRTPDELAVALGLTVGDGLGQWKSHGTARARDAVEILSSRRDSARIVAELRELVS